MYQVCPVELTNQSSIQRGRPGTLQVYPVCSVELLIEEFSLSRWRDLQQTPVNRVIDNQLNRTDQVCSVELIIEDFISSSWRQQQQTPVDGVTNSRLNGADLVHCKCTKSVQLSWLWRISSCLDDDTYSKRLRSTQQDRPGTLQVYQVCSVELIIEDFILSRLRRQQQTPVCDQLNRTDLVH